MKVARIAVFSTIVLTLILFSLPPASAQDKPASNMQFVLDKIKADKKLFIADNMGLTEAESKAFWPIYESYQKDLQALRTKTIQFIDTYAKNYNSMTNETAKQLTDNVLSLKADMAKLMASYAPKLRKALPDTKVARYIQLENKIDAAINYELAARIPLLK